MFAIIVLGSYFALNPVDLIDLLLHLSFLLLGTGIFLHLGRNRLGHSGLFPSKKLHGIDV
jgi:hypothetical protein